MAFRYDYFPYNDTIATEVYNNLYVRVFGIYIPLSDHILSCEILYLGSVYSLDMFQRSVSPFK